MSKGGDLIMGAVDFVGGRSDIKTSVGCLDCSAVPRRHACP